MSIRGKTIIIIMAIVLVITSFTLGIGMVISQHRFLGAVEATLLSVSKITSGMVSAEVGELQHEAQLIAEEIRVARPGDLQRTLNQQLEQSKYAFVNLAVMGHDNAGHDGLLASAGISDVRPSLRRDERYGKRAFAGETLITTTSYTPERELVMQIWTPIDANRVLVASLPGLYLSEFLSPYHMWETGSIYIVDGDGAFIAANQQTVRVLERHNYIELGKRFPEYQTMGLAFQNFIANDEGTDRYFLSGGERLCAYSTIPDTDNWTVVVAAPLHESPISQMRQILLLCFAILLALGIVASLIASNTIAAPYEKMETLRKTAEAASETKSRFLANVSHEMRTPLNAIIGISEMELRSSNLEGGILGNMEKINTAGTTLMNIINDLLDISKIESGKFALIPVVYDVPSLISDVVNLNIVRIGNKKIEFHLHIKGDLPLKLKGDELRVKQIFNNLLSNAFKYTSAGAVDWTINCQKEGDKIKLTSTVLDTGSGISPEDIEKLFKDYSQMDRKSNYYIQGTGLGLSITKNLVDRMGGTITVQSEPKKGSCFTVEVLQEMVGNECIGEEAARKLSEFRYVDHSHGRKKLQRRDMSYANVLVVDDVFANLDVARGMLKPYKLAIDCVTSGQDAIKRVREEKIRYDAIFMDHMMPEMDGIEAVKIIRGDIGTDYAKTVPIIALTANAMQGNDALFLEHGFQAFLSKPIDILRLDELLNQWVRDKSKETAAPQSATPVVPAAKDGGIFGNANIPGLDIAAGLNRFGNDEAAYIDILGFFVTHTEEFLETIRSGIPEKIDDYRITVHGMKGSSRSVGAEQLGDQAEKLETAAKSGDHDYIKANHAAFIEHAEKLLDGIKSFLKLVQEQQSK